MSRARGEVEKSSAYAKISALRRGAGVVFAGFILSSLRRIQPERALRQITIQKICITGNE